MKYIITENQKKLREFLRRLETPNMKERIDLRVNDFMTSYDVCEFDNWKDFWPKTVILDSVYDFLIYAMEFDYKEDYYSKLEKFLIEKLSKQYKTELKYWYDETKSLCDEDEDD